MAPDAVMEKRKEFMVSPTGGRPTLRIAHFLTPSIASIDGPVFDLPSDAFAPVYEEKLPLRVHFHGWKRPQNDWKTWVDHMHSLHHSLWKKVGIYHAVMNSTYIIHRNDDLIYGFAARWCSETNSFVFPWGEATLTLEDVIVLGGYSVLGDPVFSGLESVELRENEKKLLLARTEICKSRCKKASQSLWLRKFMARGSEIEHEAFLALWLSRFVFPRSSDDTILKCVIPIAVHLARGTKIALAPAVLASLYTNLSDLRKALVASNRLGSSSKQQEYRLQVTISAPFQLVQIWVWERFPKLQPKSTIIRHDEPRFAKWHGLRKEDIGNVKLAIEEGADHFQWRPYTADVKRFTSYKLYKEKEEWMWVASGTTDEKLDVVIRCLRVSELAGIDINCITQYLPNRVAMQFGMDQDLPGHVARENIDQRMAWKNYNRPIRDERLYVPSCRFMSEVTNRYLEWWKKSMSTQDRHTKAFVNGVNFGKSKKKMLLNNADEKKSDSHALASSNLPTKCNDAVKVKGSGNKDVLANGASYKNFMRKKFQKLSGKKEDMDPLVPPGFVPECKTLDASISDDKDVEMQAECSKNVAAGKGKGEKDFQMERSFTSNAENMTSQKLQLQTLEKTVENEHRKEGLEQSQDRAIDNGARVDLMDGSSRTSEAAEVETLSAPFLGSGFPFPTKEWNAEAFMHETSRTNKGNDRSCELRPFEVRVMELEARISNLENTIAWLKRGK